MMPVPHDMLHHFASVRIVNLPSRADRRREVSAELRAIGVDIDGERVSFFEAERPTERGPFPAVGVRGCFLSHLGVLREARDNGVSSLLLLEDDVAFSRRERHRIPATLARLVDQPWDVFYGGSPVEPNGTPLSELAPTEETLLAHFIAFSGRALEQLVPYLEAMLERPAGSRNGGPMHVDGAYNWFRAAHPEMNGIVATPGIAHQRSSATDIYEGGLADRLPIPKPVLAIARRAKNAIVGR